MSGPSSDRKPHCGLHIGPISALFRPINGHLAHYSPWAHQIGGPLSCNSCPFWAHIQAHAVALLGAFIAYFPVQGPVNIQAERLSLTWALPRLWNFYLYATHSLPEAQNMVHFQAHSLTHYSTYSGLAPPRPTYDLPILMLLPLFQPFPTQSPGGGSFSYAQTTLTDLCLRGLYRPSLPRRLDM